MHQLWDFARRFGRRYWQALVVLFIIDLLSSVWALLVAILLALAYSNLFGFGSAKGRVLSELGWNPGWSFQHWVGLLALGILLRLCFDFLKEKRRGVLSERMIRQLQPLLFAQQLRLQNTFYEERGPGRFLLRFSGDLSSLKQCFNKGVLQFSGDLILVLLGSGLIFYLDGRLGWLVIGSIALVGVGVIRLYQVVGQLEEQRRNRRSGLLSMVSRSLHGITTIRAFNQEQPFLSRFERRVDGLEQVGIHYAGVVAAARSLTQAGVYLSILLALVAMAYLEHLDMAPDSGQLFLVLLILISWRSALTRLLRVGLIWKKGAISWRKIGRLLDFEQEPGLQNPLVKLPAHPLCLDAVGFRQETHWLFRGIKAEIGQRALLACKINADGGSLALTKILAGLVSPTEGRLLLGEIEQRAVHPKSWRRRLSFVAPMFPLTGRTIFEAITYSREARHRRKAAALFEEWQALFPPLQAIQLEEPLGATSRFTSAQIQLLMWMRAILSRKAIIVADEPWAGLDARMKAALGTWLSQHRPKQSWILLSKDADVSAPLIGYQVQVLDVDLHPADSTLTMEKI